MKLSVFCGLSVDGFLARPDDALDFLDTGEHEPHGFKEFLATVATARVVFGPRMNLQAPPNLSDAGQQLRRRHLPLAIHLLHDERLLLLIAESHGRIVATDRNIGRFDPVQAVSIVAGQFPSLHLTKRLGGGAALCGRPGRPALCLCLERGPAAFAGGSVMAEKTAEKPAYTANYPRTARLNDGAEITLRLMTKTDRDAAEKGVERILTALRRNGLQSSIGVSMFPYDGTDGQTLFFSADEALYHAKQSGKNAYRFFNRVPDAAKDAV